ncbi:hypothetical protein BC831DRAFT_442760 [Entophlyctis helioformis]|nr:hypothetical protein BC831DRAFT_442760 [Entophlyctis helioformis]
MPTHTLAGWPFSCLARAAGSACQPFAHGQQRSRSQAICVRSRPAQSTVPEAHGPAAPAPPPATQTPVTSRPKHRLARQLADCFPAAASTSPLHAACSIGPPTNARHSRPAQRLPLESLWNPCGIPVESPSIRPSAGASILQGSAPPPTTTRRSSAWLGLTLLALDPHGKRSEPLVQQPAAAAVTVRSDTTSSVCHSNNNNVAHNTSHVPHSRTAPSDCRRRCCCCLCLSCHHHTLALSLLQPAPWIRTGEQPSRAITLAWQIWPARLPYPRPAGRYLPHSTPATPIPPIPTTAMPANSPLASQPSCTRLSIRLPNNNVVGSL